MRIAIAVVAGLLASAHAFADPALDRVSLVDRHRYVRGVPLSSDWLARVDDVELERDRFYLMVGRQDVIEAVHHTRVVGEFAIAGSVALAALGVGLLNDRHVASHAAGLFAFAGMALVFPIGVVSVVRPDQTTFDDARRMLTAARASQ
jgi:hypothetical protein